MAAAETAWDLQLRNTCSLARFFTRAELNWNRSPVASGAAMKPEWMRNVQSLT